MTLTAIVQITVYTCISKEHPEENISSMNDLVIISPPTTQKTSSEGYEVMGTNISTFSNTDESVYYQWPLWLEPALLMSLLIVLLHLLDRQIELTSRSDFLWMTKLRSEEDGGDTMLGINKVIKY